MKRWKRSRMSLVLSTILGAALSGAAPGASAVEPYLPDFTDLYPGTVGSALDSCLICHVTSNGGNRNDYGTAFGNAKTSSNTAGVQAALLAIELDDSDGDGIDNITEITELTFPGDCTDPDPTACGTNPEPPPGTITEGPTLFGCYKWSRFPNERFALSIKRYGSLVTTEPRNDFIESQVQTNHGVHGKHVGVCGAGTVAAVGGSFLKAKDIGSRIGLRTLAVQGDGSMDECREIVIDCFSEEDVQVPTEFECRSRNEFDVYHGKSELKLVENAADDPLCNAFDGYPATDAGDGSASGLPDKGKKEKKYKGDKGKKDKKGKKD